MSSRVQFTSGQPFTPLYGVYIPNDQSFAAIRGDLNADRYDPFFRWDLRLEKTYHRRLVDWLVYLDVYNVTSRSNPFIATYNYDYSDLYDLAGIPIIPHLDLRYNIDMSFIFLFTGCFAGFLTDYLSYQALNYEITEPRVLAVRTDPLYLLSGESVEVDALIVAPLDDEVAVIGFLFVDWAIPLELPFGTCPVLRTTQKFLCLA